MSKLEDAGGSEVKKQDLERAAAIVGSGFEGQTGNADARPAAALFLFLRDRVLTVLGAAFGIQIVLL